MSADFMPVPDYRIDYGTALKWGRIRRTYIAYQGSLKCQVARVRRKGATVYGFRVFEGNTCILVSSVPYRTKRAAMLYCERVLDSISFGQYNIVPPISRLIEV